MSKVSKSRSKMRRGSKCRLRIQNLGPIEDANLRIGDLTVIVGPQASGKSMFLQTMKLVLDHGYILKTLRQNNFFVDDASRNFVETYFGGGMSRLILPNSQISWNGKGRALRTLLEDERHERTRHESMFYIPALRTMSLPSGVSQHFGNFKYDDPFVQRNFSHRIHALIQEEFGFSKTIFPASGRLKKTLKERISKHVYSGGKIRLENREMTRSMTLAFPSHRKNKKRIPPSGGLTFHAWSSGQREFAPLLLGLYWLCPVGSSKRRGIDWVVVEEPEMGLHTEAIETFLLVILELLSRGYKVLISTHSPVVLELVWAIQSLKSHGGTERDLGAMFDLGRSAGVDRLTKGSLKRDYRVYYFPGDGAAEDISDLDLTSNNRAVSSWGNLMRFSDASSEVLSRVVARSFGKKLQ